MEELIVFATSFVLMFFRHLNIRSTALQKRYLTTLLCFVVQIATLTSMSLGVNGFLKGDYTVMAAFVIGGTLGTFSNFFVKVCSCGDRLEIKNCRG